MVCLVALSLFLSIPWLVICNVNTLLSILFLFSGHLLKIWLKCNVTLCQWLLQNEMWWHHHFKVDLCEMRGIHTITESHKLFSTLHNLNKRSDWIDCLPFIYSFHVLKFWSSMPFMLISIKKSSPHWAFCYLLHYNFNYTIP